MELKHNNPNLWWDYSNILIYPCQKNEFINRNCTQKLTLQVMFSPSCLDCPQIKVFHNFFITSLNRMNKSFTYTQKYNIWKKNYACRKEVGYFVL